MTTLLADYAARFLQSRFLRFGFVGGLGYFVNAAALWLAHFVLGFGPDVSYVLSFLVAVTFTWWANRTLTFAGHAAQSNILAEWAKFALANTLGFCANWALFSALVHLAPAPANNIFLAQAAGTLLGLVFNFTLSKRFVFRSAR